MGKNNKNKKIKKKSFKDLKDKSIFGLLKQFWIYIWYDDSMLSYILNLLVAFIFIKYLFFPGLGFVLNNSYPVVAIVSGSMEHKIVDHRVCDQYVMDVKSESLNTDGWWNLCSKYYSDNFNMSLQDYKKLDYTNGLNIGDVMVLYGKNPKNIKVGNILVFIPEDRNFYLTHGPVIHRVVKKWEENGQTFFQTKGDHNPKSIPNFETKIPASNVIGIAVLRVPYLGYPKLLLSKLLGQI